RTPPRAFAALFLGARPDVGLARSWPLSHHGTLPRPRSGFSSGRPRLRRTTVERRRQIRRTPAREPEQPLVLGRADHAAALTDVGQDAEATSPRGFLHAAAGPRVRR